jgi:hypothetical protein
MRTDSQRRSHLSHEQFANLNGRLDHQEVSITALVPLSTRERLTLCVLPCSVEYVASWIDKAARS